MLKDVHKRLDIKYDTETLQAARRGHLVDDEDTEAYKNEEGDGPTLNPFKPFWPIPKSLWNTTLGTLLVNYLISQNPQFAPDEAELLEIFLQHLKVMKGASAIVLNNLVKHPRPRNFVYTRHSLK